MDVDAGLRDKTDHTGQDMAALHDHSAVVTAATDARRRVVERLRSLVAEQMAVSVSAMPAALPEGREQQAASSVRVPIIPSSSTYTYYILCE